MKILMAPVNIVSQPLNLVKELRKQGVDVSLFQYTLGRNHRFGYDTGQTFDLSKKSRRIAEINVIKEAFKENFDIYHFWMTTFFSAPKYKMLYGLDLPYIKARGKKIIYRSTGYDVRTKTRDLEVNLYSPFRYGYTHSINEKRQLIYLDYLKDYVDQFICQDPEMAEYLPNPEIIPRSIDLSFWPFIGVSNNDRPLVVHAPSSETVKGTKFILKAVDELKSEGLIFDFKLIKGLKQDQAKAIYEKADICIDQLLIGWYGVFTIECMALGKPVIVYLREDLLKTKSLKQIPIINANPYTIKAKLKQLIKDNDQRIEISKLAREYIKNVHDVTVVSKKLLNVYNRVHANPIKIPSTSSDLEYLITNIKDYENVDIDRISQINKIGEKVEFYKNKVKNINQKVISLTSSVNLRQTILSEDVKKRMIYRDKLLKYKQKANQKKSLLSKLKIWK